MRTSYSIISAWLGRTSISSKSPPPRSLRHCTPIARDTEGVACDTTGLPPEARGGCVMDSDDEFGEVFVAPAASTPTGA
jgi:hypothetical protein